MAKKKGQAAQGKKVEEPPAKKAKSDETETKEPEEVKEKETENEQDAPKDNRPTLGKPVSFEYADCSLNVVPTMGGSVLMGLSDAGMQFLIGGARANVGLKAGRYMYEVKVVEVLQPDEGKGYQRPQHQKQMIRVGFSKAASSLILGDGPGGVAFDADGSFLAEGKKTVKPGIQFGRDQVIGVLLNLESSGPNASTVSLFRAGERACDPVPLPEDMKGEPLFPHISFRNMSVQVNFGPTQMKALPFACRMVQGAAAADAKVSAAPKGKSTVVFPVGLPDEGTFDVLDGFLEKNPSFIELSDRKVQEWAVKSGMWKSNKKSWSSSNDKPAFEFGVPMLDNMSASQIINSAAPCVPRDYVVMEVKQNLCAEDRKVNLQRFSSAKFKKVARVAMGKPSKEYIEKVHKAVLEQKQAKLTAEWKGRQAAKERKKAAEKRQKELAEARKKAEEERKKKVEEEAAKKAAEEAAKAGDGEKKEGPKEGAEAKSEEAKETKEEPKEEVKDKAEGEEPKKEEPKEEAKEEAKGEEPKKEEPKEEAKEEEEPDEPMPVAELTDDEKAMCFKGSLMSDLASGVLSGSFGKFTIPEKAEGFDEIIFEWQNEKESKAYLKSYVLKHKITSRIDDLVPGEWFKTSLAEFEKLSTECQQKVKTAAVERKEGEAEKKDDASPGSPPTNIYEVADVHDTGDGIPLYKLFSFEDWALHTLRYEFFLLATGYKKDVDDPECPGIHESNIVFYYSKYFKKSIMPKHYGKDTIPEMLTLIKDTVTFEDGVLTLKVEDDKTAEYFVKKQEEARRERQRRIDAGDETARLDFSALQKQQEMAAKHAASRAAGTRGTGEMVAPPGGKGTKAPGAQKPQWQSAPLWQSAPQGGKGGGKAGAKGRPQWQSAPKKW